MTGYCLRCKLIGAEMHDEFLCVECHRALPAEGTR